MHGRTDGADLAGFRDMDGQSGHIGIDLHEQLVAVRQAAGGNELVNRNVVLVEALDDKPGAVGGGLDQGAVDLLGPGTQGHPQHQAGQVNVDQDRAIAIPPI
jgi:hypothetical protein